MREKLSIPIIGWADLKNTTGIKGFKSEPVGCWSTRPTHLPPLRAEGLVQYLQIDPSYIQISDQARQSSDKEYTLLPRCAPFLYPNEPLDRPKKVSNVGQVSGHASVPDEQFACVDMLYFATTSAANLEWEKPWSPVWRSIGQNLRFTDRLLGIARRMLVNTLSMDNSNDLPLVRVSAVKVSE